MLVDTSFRGACCDKDTIPNWQKNIYHKEKCIVTMKNHCEIECVYGPPLLIVAYTLFNPYAVYVIFKKPLTYHVTTFTFLALAVILYTIRITVFPSRCPSNVGVHIGHGPCVVRYLVVDVGAC